MARSLFRQQKIWRESSMQKTGQFTINGLTSRVGGLLVIKRGEGNARIRATNDLQPRFEEGSTITIFGSKDTYAGEQAINMTSAQSA
jgi:hypothetical protein